MCILAWCAMWSRRNRAVTSHKRSSTCRVRLRPRQLRGRMTSVGGPLTLAVHRRVESRLGHRIHS